MKLPTGGFGVIVPEPGGLRLACWGSGPDGGVRALVARAAVSWADAGVNGPQGPVSGEALAPEAVFAAIREARIGGRFWADPAGLARAPERVERGDGRAGLRRRAVAGGCRSLVGPARRGAVAGAWRR
jgi:hypothetical protein